VRVDAARNISCRRIGTILVDRQVITADQLAHALVAQEKTGRPLGEVCVDQYSLDRFTLADVLAEQWDEMERAGAGSAREGSADEAVAFVGHVEADELRVLLQEAAAARAELVAKTDELGRRLAVVETLVFGVNNTPADPRPVTPDPVDGNPSTGKDRATTRRGASA
jgi:hypothetical protein